MNPEINYIRHHQINKQKWDDCIHSSENRIVYALSSFLDLIAPNWDALVQGDYLSVMPIIWNRKYFVGYIYNPYFSVRLGVFSKKEIQETMVREFLDHIPGKYKLFHIKFNLYNFFSLNNYRLKEHVNYELDLSFPYKTISDNYSKNHKKNIRKAAQNNIIIKKDDAVSATVSLKKELMRTRSSGGIKDLYFTRLYNILDSFLKIKKCVVYNAYDSQNQVCASASFLIFFDRAIIFSASNRLGKEYRCTYLLVDQFIKEMSGNKLILDFAGSNIKGIADFNEGFGSTKYIYPEYSVNRLRFPFSLINK